ncbi:hypothetical protein ACE1B6_11280 [Aerosakkonemataceae cyanobacterium BLCC-F154]|uniref:Uncharacterized protein n=1 Tax=Floridaenema fluviatile BLCC-F154 TaxID=3153640 RepID=A0ABV4YAI1_9CYAN
MKNLIFGGLSVLLLSAIASPTVLAQTNTRYPVVNNEDSRYLISPFDLVSMAYQGFFKNQGVPSAGALINAYALGDVEARDVVNSAVQTDRLPVRALNDRDYIKAVEWQLDSLRNFNQG